MMLFMAISKPMNHGGGLMRTLNKYGVGLMAGD